jgi:hypothetical protein
VVPRHLIFKGVMDTYKAAPDHEKNPSAKEAALVSLAAIANVEFLAVFHLFS